jgi:hypothetical protein
LAIWGFIFDLSTKVLTYLQNGRNFEGDTVVYILIMSSKKREDIVTVDRIYEQVN